MSLAGRDARARHHVTAGVHSEDWWAFQPGQRVRTIEGFLGTVTAVEDGPHAGNENYVVTLDGGMGGGDYRSSELATVSDPQRVWGDVGEEVTAARVKSEEELEDERIEYRRPEYHDTEPDEDEPEDDTIEYYDHPRQHWHGGSLIANRTIPAHEATKGMSIYVKQPGQRNFLRHYVRADARPSVHGGDHVYIDTYRMKRDGSTFGNGAGVLVHRDHPVEVIEDDPKLAARDASTLHIAADSGIHPPRARIGAFFESGGGRSPDPTQPTHARLSITGFETPDEAKEFASRFPKSLNLRGTSLSTTDDAGNRVERGYIGGSVNLQSNGVNKGVNETGIKRYHGWRKHLEAQGVPVEWHTGGAMNGYDSHEHLMEHLEGQQQRHASAQHEGSEVHVASDDYPELVDILVDRPPLQRVTPVVRHSHFASLGETDAGLFDLINDHLPPSVRVDPMNVNATGDFWCRFRKMNSLGTGDCYFPHQLDVEGTQEAGYSVWVPQRRGQCPYWTAQRQKSNCPVSEPGPNSGEANWMIDATVPWSEGGQRGGDANDNYRRPGVATQPGGPGALPKFVRAASTDDWWPTDDPEFRFQMTAAWRDVREKATRIRERGGVKIIAAQPGGSAYITAHVQGDHGTYETRIMRQPGRKIVAMWECGCKWSEYSWGRSGRWKKYEGRMCSHALALVYEAQSDEIFGGAVTEDDGHLHFKDVQTPYGAWGHAAAKTAAHAPSVSRIMSQQFPNDRGRYQSTGWRVSEGDLPGSVWVTMHRGIGDDMFLHKPITNDEKSKVDRWEAHLRSRDLDVRRMSPHIITISTLEDVPPIVEVARAYVEVGLSTTSVANLIASVEDDAERVGVLLALATSITPFPAKSDGESVDVTGFTDDGLVELHDGSIVQPGDVEYPTWSPSLGMDPAQNGLAAEGGVVMAQSDSEDGVMVALVIPQEIGATYAIEDGEPVEEMHITLAYLGKVSEVDRAAAEAAVSEWAATVSPLEGASQGWGTFFNGEDNVLLVLWDVRGLAAARTSLITFLNAHDVSVHTEHDFTAHMTVLYTDANIVDLPSWPGASELTFDHVILSEGPEWTPFPFGAGELAAAAVLTPAELPPLTHPVATLHEEPEPALPMTDGADDVDPVASDALVPPPGSYDPRVEQERDRQRVQHENGEIAAMAQRVLREGVTALKDFTPREQAELINEGIDVEAGNLDALDLTGTQYQALEARRTDAPADDDELWLDV